MSLYLGQMPLATTTPSRIQNRPDHGGVRRPVVLLAERGLMTLPPWTSWSYCRTTYSLLQTFSLPSMLIEHDRMLSFGIRVPGASAGPTRAELHSRDAVVEKVHVEIGHRPSP